MDSCGNDVSFGSKGHFKHCQINTTVLYTIPNDKGKLFRLRRRGPSSPEDLLAGGQGGDYCGAGRFLQKGKQCGYLHIKLTNEGSFVVQLVGFGAGLIQRAAGSSVGGISFETFVPLLEWSLQVRHD